MISHILHISVFDCLLNIQDPCVEAHVCGTLKCENVSQCEKLARCEEISTLNAKIDCVKNNAKYENIRFNICIQHMWSYFFTYGVNVHI